MVTTTSRTSSSVRDLPFPDFDAIVIGAGFPGLYQLHKLRDELGLRVRVLEKASGFGGVNLHAGLRVAIKDLAHFLCSAERNQSVGQFC
jgi:ribulose 1,5-bisphosphate synthetase/thiazole synthase